MVTSFKDLYTKLNTAVGYLSGFALLFAGIILFIEVICRYTGSPTDWIAETSVYLFAGAMLLGASYALMREKHVRVELLICRFSPRVQDICYLVTSLGGMVFCIIVAQHGLVDWLDVFETGETTPTTLRVPLWLTELPLFVGFTLTAIQFLIMACERVIRLKQGSPLEGLHTGGGH